MKTCIKCKLGKSLNSFYKQKGAKDGYRNTCKFCTIEYGKNSASARQARKTYYYKNSKLINENTKKWLKNNPSKYSVYYRNRVSDPVKKLKQSCRVRLCQIVKTKGLKKHKKTFDIIGIDVEGLKKYLESLFDDKMSWENHGTYWHIDHIIPLDSVNTIDDINKLCHYSNLQPLEKSQNIRKSNKILT